MTDARARRLLYASAFVRAMAVSMAGVTLGGFLGKLDAGGFELGIVVSAGLAGSAVAAIVATLTADRVGRRRFLMLTSLLGVVGTAAFALASSLVGLAAAAFVGMVNGMGKDRGAALILEQAVLPGIAPVAQRTQVIARYTMMLDLGHALGALAAGAPALLARTTSLTGVAPHRATLLTCAACGLAALAIYRRVGTALDVDTAPKVSLTPQSRAIVVRISSLFAIDSLAGGFLTTAMLSFFFFERFGTSESVVAGLFFGARILNAVSHLGAAWLAKRIGLVNTMVFTHIPSSLLLVSVAFAPSFAVAAVLFLIREGLADMDVPTRQSYVLAVVEPSERTVVSGITTLVRIAAWAVAPAFAGLIMTGDTMALPLVIGAGMKISYDLLLWRAFRGIKPPEERA
ncbi:MAG TPA: MFS transporter [Kofleriaceae bacterium]|nr:MFS transporter [Kofleriaceae bacterium]